MWQGTILHKRGGYGHVRYQGKSYRAHRLTYTLLVGEIPDGLDLDHLCRVPACVNPDHLEPVTRRENSQRGSRMRRDLRCRKCGEPLSKINNRSSALGYQLGCRPCRNDYMKRRRALS